MKTKNDSNNGEWKSGSVRLGIDENTVMVSTPNRPDGLFNKIEKESFESCIYKKLSRFCGLGGIEATSVCNNAFYDPRARLLSHKYTCRKVVVKSANAK
ncbi:MAG TPA: hypothetical protein VE566_04400 [Nitrososphaeraceae archaeon]|nr:hypothetical protein [Nitrososphaeraceae archaeon]